MAPPPRGSDANPGTALHPVATLQEDRNLARQIIQKGLTAPVDIIVHEGNYEIDEPLELRPEDSGTAAFPITWKAAMVPRSS